MRRLSHASRFFGFTLLAALALPVLFALASGPRPADLSPGLSATVRAHRFSDLGEGGPYRLAPGPIVGFSGAGGAAETLRPSAFDSADIKYYKMGTKQDCLKRLAVSSSEYCDDVYLALKEIDDYWKTEFPKLGPKFVYSPPSQIVYYTPTTKLSAVDCSDSSTPEEFCTPAFYDFQNGWLAINEPLLMSVHDDGDFGALIILAHEWGHHIQDISGQWLLNRLSQTALSIRDELQADCYAGKWAAYEDNILDHLDPGDLEEALTAAYQGGDDGLASWREAGAHGQSEQRVLAFRSGYTFPESTACDVWQDYAGQKVWEFDDHNFATYPTVTSEQFNKENVTLVLKAPGVRMHLRGRPSLTGASAASQISAISKLVIGDKGTLLDTVTIVEKPSAGAQSQSLVDKSTAVARRYEVKDAGGTFHGILYLHVRSDGGGITIDVYDDGPASGADWGPLERNLRAAILGLSLN